MKYKKILPFALTPLLFVACNKFNGDYTPQQIDNNTASVARDTVWVLNNQVVYEEWSYSQRPYINARLGNKNGRIYTETCPVKNDWVLSGANIGDQLVIEPDNSINQEADKIHTVQNLSEEARLAKLIKSQQNTL